jgi:hypothetical protein
MANPAVVMAVTSVVSAVAQGISAEGQAKSDQLALENEKEQLLKQRGFLDEARDEELDLFRRETEELLGLQEVGFAKAGIAMEGSAIRVLRETARDAKEEEDKIMRQYDRYRSISEIKERSYSNQIAGVRYQRGLITPTSILGAVSGGARGFYTGRSLSRSKAPSKAPSKTIR